MCDDCHTPRNEKGAPISGKDLAGAPIDFKPVHPMPWASTAPEIARLAGWKDQEVVTFLIRIPPQITKVLHHHKRGIELLVVESLTVRCIEHKLTVCTNLPCALSGANDAVTHIKQKLGIGFNQTTADGKFTLKEGECMGACGDAPVLLVNNKRMCSFMSNDSIDQLLEELNK